MVFHWKLRLILVLEYFPKNIYINFIVMIVEKFIKMVVWMCTANAKTFNRAVGALTVNCQITPSRKALCFQRPWIVQTAFVETLKTPEMKRSRSSDVVWKNLAENFGLRQKLKWFKVYEKSSFRVPPSGFRPKIVTWSLRTESSLLSATMYGFRSICNQIDTFCAQ